MTDDPLIDSAGDTSKAELLGSRIRSLRRTRALTLVQVADRAGLSHPFLSQLERGLTNPSMTSLERIAVALGTGVVELLAAAEPREKAVSSGVLRASDGVRGPYGAGHARLLGPEMLSFVPLELTGANLELGDTYTHSEDEFMIVVEGAIDLELDGVVHRLEQRDSAIVAGGSPHRWRSIGGRPYRLFVVKEEWGSMALRDAVRQAEAARVP